LTHGARKRSHQSRQCVCSIDRPTGARTGLSGAEREPGADPAQRAVAARAAALRGAVAPGQADLLIAAAWVHDIGYATALQDTKFHPLDDARFLRFIGWEPLLRNLVAHHSGSRFVAAVKGLDAALDEFDFTEDPLSTP